MPSFDFDALVTTRVRATQSVRRKFSSKEDLPAADLPKALLTQTEKKAVKQFKKKYHQAIEKQFQAELHVSQKRQLFVFAALLEALKPLVDFKKINLFDPRNHPILQEYGLSHSIFIRESVQHPGEWRVEILDSKPLGEGSTGMVYNSRWVVKVKPTKGRPISEAAIDDIQLSNKVIKVFSPIQVMGLLAGPSITTDAPTAIDDELKAVQRFTGKGQRYLEADQYKYYLIMQRALGNPLDPALNETSQLPYESIVFLAYQLLRNAATIHEQGWVHTDIKPENILVDTSKSSLKAGLIDFSGARPIGFTEISGFGSPIIASKESATASRKHPCVLDATMDSPELAASVGVLFGGHPFAARIAKQAEFTSATSRIAGFEAAEILAAIPYDFSDLFSALTDKPNSEQQAVIRQIVEQMCVTERAERMTASQAVQKLERLHPEFGHEIWHTLQHSFRRALVAMEPFVDLRMIRVAFEKLLAQLDRFVQRKNDRANTQNPIDVYHYFMQETITLLDVKMDMVAAINPAAAAQWAQIVVEHFQQPTLQTFFSSQHFLTFQAKQWIASTKESGAKTVNPKLPFVVNLVILLDQAMQHKNDIDPAVAHFINNHFFDLHDFTITQVFSMLLATKQPLRNDCLVQLISNKLLNTEQKIALEPIILAAVAMALDPAGAPAISQEVACLYNALLTDTTGLVRQAIVNFSKQINAEQAAALLAMPVVMAENGARQIPAAQAEASPIAATHTATPEIERPRDASLARQNTALATRILAAAGKGLFAPTEPLHFAGESPPPTILTAEKDSTTSAVPAPISSVS